MRTAHGHSDSKTSKRNPLKPPHRRLILMFDGTGNQRMNLSNVARMFEAIDDSKPQDYEPYKDGRPVLSKELCILEPDRQPVQLLKYIKGVGTDFFGHLSGLGFGFGLSANVIEGYVWLSNNYCEGDEIFVFGFSRGAFSARSLVSLVHRCGGVVKNTSISAKNQPELKVDSPVVVKAYDMYQAYVQTSTKEGVDKRDAKLNADYCTAREDFITTAEKGRFRIHRVTVKMLGVWDTVGAVGLPETGIKFVDNNVYPFSRYSSKQYQFHDQGLSCIVENAYHALAIDEHRKHFSPTLWNAVTPENQEVKQVWFVGSHCNVGGGADLDDLDDPDDLWQYSYVWMQNHAMKHGLRFYWTYNLPPTQTSTSNGQHPIRTRRVSLRTPENSYANFLGGYYKWFFGEFDREAIETQGARLHWSVTDRIAVSAVKPGERPYRPKTLFGKYGTQFTNVAPDVVELQKLDTHVPGLVTKSRWQIETDDAGETKKPGLPQTKCGCEHEVVAPKRKAGSLSLWS